MLSENTVKKILEHGLKQGADFTEVFVEDLFHPQSIC